MATEVIVPKLGMNTDVATIVRWHKHEGDRVLTGDVLADIETDKVTMELEAETAGIVRRLLAGDGEQVAITQTIAIIGSADEDISALMCQVAGTVTTVPRHIERVRKSWTASGAVDAELTKQRRSSLADRPTRAEPREPDPEAIRARLTQRSS